MKSTPSRRITFIDALRGVAAISVLIQHIADRLIFHHASSETFLRSIFVDRFDAGRFGVAIFFIISGFVIPFSIRGARPLYNFAISRLFRLYPAYWVSIVGASLVLFCFNGYVVPLRNILINATMLEGALGVAGILGPYWTLIIELAFYFACTALYAFGWLQSKFVTTLMFLGCVCLCWLMTFAGMIMHHYYSANILLNMALMFYGLIIRRDDEAVAGKAPMDTIMGGLLLLFSIPVIISLAPVRHDGLFTPMSFSSGYVAGIIAFLACHKWAKSGLGLLVWLGSISYSVYLLHEIFLIAFERQLQPGAGLLTQAIFVALAVGSSLIGGFVVYRFVELPAIRLGKRFAARRVPTSQDADQALARN